MLSKFSPLKLNSEFHPQALNTLSLPRKTYPGPSTTEEKPQHLKVRLRSTSLTTECNKAAVPETRGKKPTSLQLVETTTTCKGHKPHRLHCTSHSASGKHSTYQLNLVSTEQTNLVI